MTGMKTLWAAAGAALLIAAIAPNEAEASVSVGVEAGPVLLLDPPPDTSLGFGFAGRLGYTLGLPVLSITPEVKVAYDRVPEEGAIRAMIGGRAEIGALLSPIAFAHIGYGRAGSGDAAISGVALDVGAGLLFTPLPIIDVGIIASYNRVLDDPIKLHWIFIGATANLGF
jgi:hypothetical protein